ncbi:MAG: alpha-amylase family glycosyl hydrolase [Bacteroidota bacterium]|nr:alpha-amylase family glycosyl hydrolase [Bacteroidota bacterium]
MNTSLLEVQETLAVSKAKVFPSPEDWRDLWIYFLLVDRFNNPDKPPTPNNFPCNLYQGGNFAGIRQQLSYLKNLGVGAIWLSPVLENPQWFSDYWGGYGISNFLRIEPRFCSNPIAARANPKIADDEFRQLVDEAHKLGIYVILDIVLNHVGDVFNYEGIGASAPWNPNGTYKIHWRDEDGNTPNNWSEEIALIANLSQEAGIHPVEFQHNDFFRRRGNVNIEKITQGDFDRLKELVTEYQDPNKKNFPVRDALIRSYEYLIAKFDIDGFRIDTLQYIEPEFARIFGNAIREYALSIGKKNFFHFGEVWQDDDDAKVASFIGRDSRVDGEIIGIDAAINFPLRKRLYYICKGYMPPAELAHHYDYQREVYGNIISSHANASSYLINFCDNHDLNDRFHNPNYPEQTKVMLTCLMTLSGIPCIYYGTEQGMWGNGDRREYAREAMWGKYIFSEKTEFFKLIKDLSEVRAKYPALRYGRQYFRPISGNGIDFDYSPYCGGVIAFSRILSDSEVLIVANTHTSNAASVYVTVDENLNPVTKKWKVVYSTQNSSFSINTEVSSNIHTVPVTLKPLEALILT